MRLFTLFINDGSGNHYCGVYPTLEYLYDVIREFMAENEISKDEIPELEKIRHAVVDGNSEDFWHEYSDGTWIHVQETSEGLVEVILDEYFEEFYLDIAARLDLKVESLQKSKE